MQKMTLLEMTQNILSAMSSDEVNSIADTVESLQVAEEIRNTFYELFSNREIPEFFGLVNLEGLGDTTRPNVMQLPSNSTKLKWIRYKDYRNNGELRLLDYISPEEFMERFVFQAPSGGANYTNTKLMTTNPYTYSVRNDKCPDYYTSFDDLNLVLDSYDSLHETTLTGGSTMAWGIASQSFSLTDDFTPPVDANLFPLLLSEAKSACFVNVKQVASSKEEQRARRQLVRSQNDLYRASKVNREPYDYSRKR